MFVVEQEDSGVWDKNDAVANIQLDSPSTSQSLFDNSKNDHAELTLPPIAVSQPNTEQSEKIKLVDTIGICY